MKQNQPVLIVGAGPAGLTAAMELSRWGIPVRIIDKASQPSTTSRALALQARTLELLSQRGVADEMLRLGNPATAVNIHGDSKQLASINLKSIPSRFNFVLLLAQNDTERLLSEQLRSQGVSIERSTELIAFSQPEPAPHADFGAVVKAVLRHGDGRLEELDAAYLICAEGAHSNIRHTLNLEFKGKSLEQSYALADLHIDGDIPQDSLTIFTSKHGLLAVFPMGNRRFRVIATDPEHHVQNAGEPDLNEMQKLYDAGSYIPATLRDPVWTSRFRINSRMLDTFRAGRIFFGGDSAHIHSPAGGQGMNTGIQDMINIGWKMALVYRGQASAGLLDTYSEERVPVIRSLVAGTEKATDAANSTNPVVHQLVTHVAPFLLDFHKVQEIGARTLSQVEINYRSSRLSETKSAPGGLHAGDRVPDLNVVVDGSGASPVALYTLLDPSAFTLLITGDTRGQAPSAGWPPFMKIVRVREAEGKENEQAFRGSFGAATGLFAVRPDAYLGFAAGINHAAELNRWFDGHILANQPSSAS
jgi:2-polyprenyl-6-methoxyphenol hydroxylase-like FAD-dependent oxidoreductase